MPQDRTFSRRQFLALSGGTLVLASCSSLRKGESASIVRPNDAAVQIAENARAIDGSQTTKLSIVAGLATFDLAGQIVNTWAYDGLLPGKEVRVRQGDALEVDLLNNLPEHTTIHWHGLALRNNMDGMAAMTQSAVQPGERFTYSFIVPDSGTYWFHPHMGLQLDRGLYAPLIVSERDDPGSYDVDQVIVLDDWLDGVSGTPEDAFRSLTEMMGDMGDSDSGDMGGMDHGDMGDMDSGMSMSRFQSELLGGDAGDVPYPMHLLNGRPPTDRPTYEVPAGGRVKLRFINAGSDTAYRVAIGGHRMRVTHADGFAVQPVEVDALLIGMGERYDVEIEPKSGAWPLAALAEGKDMLAVGVIRTSDALASSAPPIDVRPAELDGQLLQYSDLRATDGVQLPVGEPDVEATLELTGSMMPYSWSMNGGKFPDNESVEVRQGDRVRLHYKNKTQMWHPMHLHGHTFRVGDEVDGPRKDTVIVLPGETKTVEFIANNPGQWMNHCHNTYHLEQGMANVLSYVY